MPFYSGGLGILAGDHLKSASDLGIPLVAVGLLYRRGYFRQEVEAGGEQQHIYPSLDVRRLPGPPGRVAHRWPAQESKSSFLAANVQVAVWKLDIGRVPLLLLDTDIPENDVSDRPITHTLYVRGRPMRLCQEIVLGIGSVRVLEALGIKPSVWHINEGHAALAILELIRARTTAGAELTEAYDSIKQQTIFTLHTPVPAGNEVFDRSLTDYYLQPLLEQMPVKAEQLANLGVAKGDTNRFDLGALAIEMSSVVNGVSKRHAEIATATGNILIGGPAHAVTNGVHTPSWIGRDSGDILTDRFGRNWPSVLLDDRKAATHIAELTPAEIWSMHQVRKEIFTNFVRGRLRRQFARHGVSPDELREVDEMLPNDRLTLGFARRFASYKRATLMFTDLPRFEALVTNPERPVQVVFAGKAHPADRPGQDFIRQIYDLSQRPSLKGHIFMLEDYDARMARFMVQGVDVWVNNPRPPMEASGTSGMKAAINGTLNLSVLDGWWVEGYNGHNGWAFGSPDGNHDQEGADQADALAFYELMEDEVVPAYYDQDKKRAVDSLDQDDARVGRVDPRCVLQPPDGGGLRQPGLLPDGDSLELLKLVVVAQAFQCPRGVASQDPVGMREVGLDDGDETWVLAVAGCDQSIASNDAWITVGEEPVAEVGKQRPIRCPQHPAEVEAQTIIVSLFLERAARGTRLETVIASIKPVAHRFP